MLEFFSGRTDEHVTHEESMVRASTDNANVDSVAFVPSSEAIDDVYPTSSVEVIDRTFSVDFPYLRMSKQGD